MPEYVHPGVYVEEIERGPRPIEGVPTDTAAFVGPTEYGPNAPRRVTSEAEYRRRFGDALGGNTYMPHAVRGFFENGGRRLYVARVVASGASTASATFGDFSVRAVGPGASGIRILARVSEGTTKGKDGSGAGVRLQLAYWRGAVVPFDPFAGGPLAGPSPDLVEDFDDLVADETSPNYFGKRIAFLDLTTGRAVVAHCEAVGFRFAVVDGPAGAADVACLDPRFSVGDSSHGAYYHPWIATVDAAGAWKYVNVRRLLIFLEHSIYRGTQWVVFEPNDQALWSRVSDTIRQFLRSQWRNGALMGQKEEEAFFISCDRTTMTEDDILSGRLVCIVGVAPLRPAEFVLFRIGQWTAEAKQ